MITEQVIGDPVDDARDESKHLPQREWVWVLSDELGLCMDGIKGISDFDCIMVFRCESDAIDELRQDNWEDSKDGVTPIQLTLESVKQQVIEQGCAGYVWLPDDVAVEVHCGRDVRKA